MRNEPILPQANCNSFHTSLPDLIGQSKSFAYSLDHPVKPCDDVQYSSSVIARLDPRFHGDAIQEGHIAIRPYASPRFIIIIVDM